MWLLLLVVAALANCESFPPEGIIGQRPFAQSFDIYPPHPPLLYGSATLRDNFLQHVLYGYRISPHEVNIRHHGQNPVNYVPPYVEAPVRDTAFQANTDGEEGFSKDHIQFRLDQDQYPFRPYSFADIFDEENGIGFNRYAVEQPPMVAQKYISENAIQDDVPFSRSGVESLPSVPYATEIEDEELNAIVLYADDYDKVGYRAGVESPPIRNEPQDPVEAYPMLNSLNSRQYGHLSEATLSAERPDREDGPYINTHDLRESVAGGDLVKYQANIRSQNGDYKLVCYYGGWSVYRPAPFDFSVTDIDPFSCTHVIYSFAGLKDNEYTIQALDEELDIIKGAYKAAVGLKQTNPDLKVMIAIGGWNEGGKKYSAMASTKERRDKFVQSVISFLQEHQFDGLDLDWEYPGASDRGGRWGDKKNFADLVEELAVAFRPHGWILSAAVSPARFRVNEGYDVPRLAQHLDFINIMTYDLRGPWDGKADHHSPIESRPTDAWAYKSLNTKDGIDYWAEKGAPKNKLLMGIPFYGRSFTLSNPSDTAPGARVKSGGNEGQYTQERGFLAYYEVCMEERNGGWTSQQDAAGGPYMTKGDQWVGYDDKGYVAKKMDMVKSEGLGGAMIWAIDLDDYQGVCGERWPLLTTMRRGLGIKASVIPVAPNTETPVTLPAPETTTEPIEPGPVSTIRPVDSTTPTQSPDLVLDVKLPCQEGNYMRDPSNCGAYFLCVHGEWVKFSCQSPLQWDQNKRICDWPSNVNCKAVPVPVVPTTGGSEPPKISVPSSGSLSGDYMVVCYFTNWAWYRPGIGKYKPEDIDPTICTHIVYGFAVLDYSNLVIKTHDSWADIDNKFYEKVTALRSKGIKVTLAIGGWNDSLGDKYSRLVNNPSARRKFINHVIEFIKKHNFDGLDLDWEYPVCWQVDCKKGPKSDKENFALWVKELKDAFEPHGLLLSAAVSPSKKVIDEGYDVPMLNRYLDWIAVMTYDFHGHWDKKTGHVAPMFYHPESDYDYFNMDYAIRYWLEKGASKNKIVLGMPLYGQSFSINDPQNTGLNSPARSGGQAGPFTRARGFLAYYEICHNIRQGWTVVKDPEHRIGPYAYSGNQWVSFDDADMLRRKSEYIRDMGLAGGMVWALDLDDFTNRCGQGAHPLMNAIKAVLGPSKVIIPRPNTDVQEEGTNTTEPTSEPSDPVAVINCGTAVNQPDGYKVVCYFTNWAWYRNGEGKYTPSEIDPSLCTHIVYGFAVLDGSRLIIKPHDTWADYDNKFYERVTALRKDGVKVLVAIGGWNDSAGNKYSRLVSTSDNRRRFIEHVINFIRENNFDGLDLDWEYPVCWQVDCKKGPEEDKANFAAFVKELHEAFKPHNLLLSAAVSPSNKVIDMGYDVPALDKYLDWIAVMTYDYHGQWDKKTGHVAPMYAHSQDDNLAFNTNFTINYWIEKGANRKKLVLGMPMYGQSFSLAQASDNGLNQKTYGGGEAGPYTRARGFLAYYEICYKIKHEGWQVVRDVEQTMGPYAYRGDQWVGFDDIETIRYKTKWLMNMGLGGAMIWALDLDDFRNRCGCEHHPLLRTINRELRNNQGPDPACAPLRGEIPVPPPPITPPSSAASPPLPVPKQTCQAGTRKPHESDCKKFYECVHGEKMERQCFPGLHWNSKENRCDWPNKAGCSSVPPGPDPEPSTPPPIVDSTITTDVGITKTTTTTTTTTTAPPSLPDTGYKVICYFTNWAWYRQGIGKYKPEDIDPDLCTHIVYGFAVLDSTRLLIKPHDTWADLDNAFYKKVTDMKARGVKVLIAIGGWNDSAGDKYSRLVNNPTARARFNEHVVEFILKNNFDGLDLDWEYPVCWQVDCAKGNPNDKQAFGDWVRELHTAFQPHGLLLTAAVSPSNKVIDAGYDVPIVNRYLDWINVMTYDYHGHWDKKTGHVAPMYHHPGHENPAFNTNYTIHYWIEKGADRKKLMMGMPMYGQAFGLGWKANGTGLGQHAPQKGQAGQYTRAAGFLAYYEMCDKVLNGGFTVVKDPEGRIGPYAYNGKQWFGYDDIAMIRYKSEYIKKMGLGGGMIWALDLDDFRNRCGCESHPLLRTINRVLRNYPVADPNCNM